MEPRGGETGGLSEVPDEMTIGLLHVRLEHLVRQIVKPAAPHDMVHATVQAQLVAFRLE